MTQAVDFLVNSLQLLEILAHRVAVNAQFPSNLTLLAENEPPVTALFYWEFSTPIHGKSGMALNSTETRMTGDFID